MKRLAEAAMQIVCKAYLILYIVSSTCTLWFFYCFMLSSLVKK